MRLGHFEAWAPHCPACRRDRGTMPALLLAEGAIAAGEDVIAGTLVCADAGCRAEYPIIDGVPLIMANLRTHLAERAAELLLRDDLDPATLSLLGDALGPESWFDTIRQGVSTYAWDGYGDLDPAEAPVGPPPGPSPGSVRRCLRALLALAAPWPAGGARRVLDLGCAAGRTAFDAAVAAPGALVLGIDGNLALLRLAQRVARTGVVAYGRRRIGLVYDERRFETALAGRDRVDFWACDAAALPLAAESADLLLMLNLLDCVPDPLALLRHAASMLRPGGALLLATPFDWARRATPPENWVGGHSQRGEGGGAAEPLLRALLSGTHAQGVLGLAIAGSGEHEWHTRLHDRATVAYRTHLLACTRLGNELPLDSANRCNDSPAPFATGRAKQQWT